jgi:hypothetical protein
MTQCNKESQYAFHYEVWLKPELDDTFIMKVVFMSSDKATFHYANHHNARVQGSKHMRFWNMSEIALT